MKVQYKNEFIKLVKSTWKKDMAVPQKLDTLKQRFLVAMYCKVTHEPHTTHKLVCINTFFTFFSQAFWPTSAY